MYVLFYVYVGIGFVDWYERFLSVCLLINSYNELSLIVLRWPCVMARTL